MANVPLGIWILEKSGFLPAYYSARRTVRFKWVVFVLTFLTYTSYHASRKPISVVKNVLNQNCTGRVPPAGVNPYDNKHWCDWPPFDGADSNTLLGFIDSAYLFSYAFFMFFSGYVAERMDLRYFLTLGMLMSALFTWAFGAAYYWQVHSLAFFICIQVVTGIFEASGWPGVVTVMGNWNGRRKRGLIFGIWNSHTSLGNIIGSLMAGWFVDTNWGLSFIVPGIFIATIGIVDFLFLTPYPEEIGCNPPSAGEPVLLSESLNSASAACGSGSDSPPSTPPTSHITPQTPLFAPQTGYESLGRTSASAFTSAGSGTDSQNIREQNPGDAAVLVIADGSTNQLPAGADADQSTASKTLSAATSATTSQPGRAIGFWKALFIPGVIPFAVCLFFAKLVSYTFLYWLPRYLHSAANYSPSESANLSTLFDVGGIAGGILAGFLNDWTGAPGIVCVILLIIAIPIMFVYQTVATVSHGLNTLMLLVVGLLVNGPYALITTAVSADLGTSLSNDAKALATVTAIIDGTGSVGAGLGPLLAGWVSEGDNWTNVFIILMVSDAIAVLSLGWVLRREVTEILQRRRERRQQLTAAA